MTSRESVAAVIRRLRQAGVSLWEHEGRLMYKASGGALSPGLREELAARRGELLDFLRRARPNAIPLVPSGARRDRLPLSFAQQRLWFLDQLEGLGPAYNMRRAFRLTGSFDVEIFRRCVGALVARHEILRTEFHNDAGRAIQHIAPSLTMDVPVIDLRHVAGDAQRAALERQIKDAAESPFDLSRAPLMRARVLRLGEERWTLLVVMHHIIADGWSMGVLMQELTRTYSALAAGQSPALPELPIQYADFAVWQRNWLQGEVLAEQLRYWHTALDGAPSRFQLPTDRSRLGGRGFAGATVSFALTPELTSRVLALSKATHATLFMTLLAAFAALLHRYSRQSDIVIGSAIANRNRVEIEPLIGLFVNMLVLRLEVSEQATFRELVDQARQVALGAYDHQDIPLEKLVEELRPERSLEYNPLYQVSFVLQNTGPAELRLGDVAVHPLSLDHHTAKDDLTLTCYEEPEHVRGEFEYSTDIFDAATISWMSKVYVGLLEAAVASPDQALSELTVRIPSMPEEPVPPRGEGAPQACVHHGIEARARSQPDAIAVQAAERSLTYAELEERASGLAHHLRRRGVARGDVVGLCVVRSIEMIVAMLALFKVGAAYVPLDPSDPEQLLRTIAGDAAFTHVVTQPSLDTRWLDAGVVRIEITTGGEPWPHDISSEPVSGARSGDLACIMYTSGSTGAPKGVMITHASLAAFVASAIQIYRIRPDDRVLQFFSPCFDGSLEEVFPCLHSGATLVLRSEEMARSVASFWASCQAWKISVLDLPTAFWHQLIAEIERPYWRLPETTRLVIIGGERAEPKLVATWQQHVGDVPALINSYGPTEATVSSTFHVIERRQDTDYSEREVPIGVPLPHVEVHVLDAQLRPVPPTVPGELHIGGAGVARGYLHQPEQTAQRFIKDPFSSDPERRLFKTGDWVRRLPDGKLVFLQRMDHQVKVRGFRVELGAIEATLASHPLVRRAVVVARAARNVGNELVAYVVAEQASASSSGSGPSVFGREQVTRWQTLFEDTYAMRVEPADPTFDISGWNSHDTRAPIPAAEMRAWVDNTVRRIEQLEPSDVLEIGCGTGLMLFRVAPRCQRYVGTDFSGVVLDDLRRALAPLDLGMVTLLEREANDFSQILAKSHDTVVVNSVIQYFPSVSYLADVLASAVAASTVGGKIFIGDVRDLGLLKAFHVAVELDKAPPDLPLTDLRALVDKRLAQEEELLLSPSFFHALARQIPRIRAVQILLKRGRDQNELTRFRYDVVLHLDGDEPRSTEWRVIDWSPGDPTLADLRGLLRDDAIEGVWVRDANNRRVERDVRAQRSLDTSAEGTAADLRARVSETMDAWDPEDVWELGEALGWHVQVCWAGSGDPARFDAFLARSPNARPPSPRSRATFQAIEEHANNPLHAVLTNKLLPDLRRHVSQALPEYMRPAAYVFLDAFPLTSRGKINRHALPVPNRTRLITDAVVPPRNPLEASLAKLWRELLDLDQVGIHDDFFALGGHSLLAVLLMSRVHESFRVELRVRALFENPTIARFASVIEAADETSQSAIPDPKPVSRAQPLPASAAQERFWFMHQLEGAHAAYNVSCALRWRGPLDLARLGASIRGIAGRHEALRTTFADVDGQLTQVIHPEIPAPVIEDLRAWPSHELEGEVRRRVQESVRTPFDLSRGPLMRARLLRCRDDDHAFVLTLHHAISDAWSVGVFMNELSALYAADGDEQQAGLPELPIQYADFAAWQRAMLAGGALAPQLEYWRRQLSGAPPLLELPTDRPRPAVQQRHGASVPIALPSDIHRALLALSRREGVTLFMTLLAAWKVLLHRCTGQDDLLVSTGDATRSSPKLEPLIGCFVNVLVLRTNLGGAPSFLELVQRVREVTLQAYSHRDVPFEQLVRALGAPRDMSYHPLAQVMFILQNAPVSPPVIPGIASAPIPIEGETAQLDVNIQMWEEADGLAGYISYDTSLFDAATITRMRDGWATLLRAALTDPRTPITVLPLLSPEERRRQLVEWNASQTPFPREQCLHHLFAQQARSQPEAVAIWQEGRAVTYAELACMADGLARDLRSRGVGPDVVVGICMERSVPMVAGILGILAAGGAYLPLDPSYPAARLRFMAEDVGLRWIVTERGMRTVVDPLGIEAIELDPASSPARTTAAPEPVEVTPEHLAYLIFTSGSTGEPKAIAVEHRGVVNNVTDLNRRYHVGPSDRVLVLSSSSFDMSVYETLGILAAGGAMVIPTQAQAREPAAWAALVREHGVTVWNSAPALLTMLMDHVEPRPEMWPRSLRVAFLGGDWIPVSIPDRLRAMTERTEIVCMGGATEASIHSIVYDVQEVDPRWTSIPYGKPMANQQAFILDVHRQPVPIGVPGELHLGGVGLARGYYRRPEQTRMKFIPAPFPEVEGGRLYKTGDRARYWADGTIELLGRLDFQIKYLGYRIELEEIASALEGHPAVKQAVVVVTGDPRHASSQQLVAHVVPNGPRAPEPADLRGFLETALPVHMIPSVFHVLASLPLSVNGKVDRARLMASTQQAAATTTFAPPRSAVEAMVAMVWAEVLGRSNVGIHDNFFAQGGHSLTAVRIISRLQSFLSIEIALRALFQAPTVAQLAAALASQGRRSGVDVETIADLVMKVHGLSDEEVDALL
ncbi:amino acid adenylation domain-containing protein [Sorangium sp. So ce216]